MIKVLNGFVNGASVLQTHVLTLSSKVLVARCDVLKRHLGLVLKPLDAYDGEL